MHFLTSKPLRLTFLFDIYGGSRDYVRVTVTDEIHKSFNRVQTRLRSREDGKKMERGRNREQEVMAYGD